MFYVIVEFCHGTWNIVPEESILGVGAVLDALLGVHLAEHHKEVVALVALDKARGADKGLNVRAGVAALGARQRGRLLAAPAPAAWCAGPAAAGSWWTWKIKKKLYFV